MENEAAMSKAEYFASEIYSVLHDFAWVFAITVIVFTFLVRLVAVDGSSMFPTLVDRDYLCLLSNAVCGDYEQGDVVVATVPSFSSKTIVKRVIATEGQVVNIDFDAGVVYVDGTPLDEPYTFAPTHVNYPYGMDYPLTVPEGCVFLMGDNRNHSTDSRYAGIGPVDTRNLIGKVLTVTIPGSQTNEYGEIVAPRKWKRIGIVR